MNKCLSLHKLFMKTCEMQSTKPNKVDYSMTKTSFGINCLMTNLFWKEIMFHHQADPAPMS